jgi:hypothetical protein
MWEPQSLTTLWVLTVGYKESFTFTKDNYNPQLENLELWLRFKPKTSHTHIFHYEYMTERVRFNHLIANRIRDLPACSIAVACPPAFKRLI